MSRVYTVKSNARRDAKKLGLNPDLVKEVKGGWAIDYPDVPAAKAEKPAKAAKVAKPKTATKPAKPKREKAPKPAKAPRAPMPAKGPPRTKREGDPKKDRLIAMLADWTPIGELVTALGWLPHTVRAAISVGAEARGVDVERRRVDGVTSYRIVPAAEAKAA